MEAIEVLEKYWGYTSFRNMQKEIVDAALSGKDVLAILPTGGGKSVCFQVPAMMKPGMALVITPLIALMKDQVQNLNDRGIKALAVYMGMSRREIELALNNAVYGDFKFLYISPERLSTAAFREFLKDMDISYIVVDEAHCISQWGYDFRPDYLKIADIRNICDAPVMALTATATPQNRSLTFRAVQPSPLELTSIIPLSPMSLERTGGSSSMEPSLRPHPVRTNMATPSTMTSRSRSSRTAPSWPTPDP